MWETSQITDRPLKAMEIMTEKKTVLTSPIKSKNQLSWIYFLSYSLVAFFSSVTFVRGTEFLMR